MDNNLPGTMQLVEPPQLVSRRSCILFCTLFVAVQLCLVLGSFWIASQPWFLSHNAYPRFREQSGYSLRAQHLDCEILIYGDSTALVDLEPAVIQQRTGLKTCNVAETAPVHLVIGSEYPLDQYLAHNSAPQFILGMWVGDSFHPEMKPMTAYWPEGVLYGLQYHRERYLWEGLLRHPDWAVEFSTWVIRSLLTNFAEHLGLSTPRYSKLEATPRDIRAGLWDIDQSPETTCNPTQRNDPFSQQEKEENLAAFRRRYSNPRTKVILDIAPMAMCIDDLFHVAKSNEGLYDNHFELLPVNQFNMNGTHMIRAATHRVSEEAADQILGLMHDENVMKPKPSKSSPANP